MAPELALEALAEDQCLGPVLDPMCGSGTVLRAAASAGYEAIGFDLDPLAVLMSRVWTAPIEPDEVIDRAERVVASAMRRRPDRIKLPWLDNDQETTEFVDYWFAAAQQHDLRRLAGELIADESAIGNVLRLALSRIIVTKEHGASLARDVSHSRPHRTRLTNDFDVLRGFIAAARQIARRINPPASHLATASIGDARDLTSVEAGSIGRVITSPPYLNAIDYLRGHRLALVWLGYKVSEVRAVRSISIGAERSLHADDTNASIGAMIEHVDLDALPARVVGMLARYAQDLRAVMREISRVVARTGHLVLVLGNSTVRGTFIDNARIAEVAAVGCGLELVGRSERALPMAKRYLPPPSTGQSSDLTRRMRSEVVMRFSKV